MKIIPSSSAGSCVDYFDDVGSVSIVDRMDRNERGQRARVLFASGQHCRPETAKAEFKALRDEHGRDGEMRTVPATYITVDQLESFEPTHLKMGKNWRAAKAGEAATHYRVEPAAPFEKRSEAFHYIIAFAPDTVNRDDPEQCRKAFEAVEAMWAQDYPGTQAKLVAHGDAKGSKEAQARGEEGKFHVHVAANAIIHTEMEVDGRTYKAGQRMSGALTNVDRMRERWDTFLETRGHEFALEPQNREVLPEVGSDAYRDKPRRTNQDFWENERGQISDHDRARRGLETAFENLAQDPAAMAQLDQNERLQRLADEVSTTGDLELKMRSTKAGEKIRSFVVPDRQQAIGATKLGGRYSNDGVAQQLELIAQGNWKPFERVRSGPTKPIAALPEAEVVELQHAANGLAAQEIQEKELDAWLRDWASEQDISVDELWANAHRVGSPADRKDAQGWKETWDAKQEAAQKEAAQTPPHKPAPAQKTPSAQPAEVTAEELLTRYRDEYPSELDAATKALAADYREKNPKESQQMIDLLVSSQLKVRAAGGSLEPRLEMIRTGLRESSDLIPETQSANQKLAARVAEVEQQSAPDVAQVDQPELRKSSAPVAATSSSPVKNGAKQAAPAKARKLTDIGRLGAAEMHDRELIAVVRREHANGGAYVDFQLAADDSAAAGRTGLYLHAKHSDRTDPQGRTRQITNTWQQLSRSEYANLQLSAGDNHTEVGGQQVYAVRGNVVPWGQGGNGYDARVDSLAPSKRTELGEDVLQKQHQSEDRGRSQKMTDLNAKVNARADAIKPDTPAQTPQEEAFQISQQRTQRSRSRDGRGR